MVLEDPDSGQESKRETAIHIHILVCPCAYTCTDYSGSDDNVGQEAQWIGPACCYHNFDHNFYRPDVRWNVKTRGFVGLDVGWSVKKTLFCEPGRR